MKKSRLASAAVAATLVAGTMFLAGPAIAADVYVPDNSIGAETNPYSNGWFFGNASPAAPAVDDASGLALTGLDQVLYGGLIDIADGAAFEALAAGSAVDAEGAVFFQYPVFFNSGNPDQLGFTTLRPAAAGTPSTTGDWISSQTVTVNGVQVLTANEVVPFADIVAAFDAAIATEGGAQPQVLAVGVLVDTGATALVKSVTFSGNTHFFTAQAAAPVPTPVERDATFTG